MGNAAQSRNCWSLIFYTHIPIRPTLPLLTFNVPWLTGSLGGIVYFWPQQIFCNPVFGRSLLSCYWLHSVMYSIYRYTGLLYSVPSAGRQQILYTCCRSIRNIRFLVQNVGEIPHVSRDLLIYSLMNCFCTVQSFAQ